jgi:hypothetical protein
LEWTRHGDADTGERVLIPPPTVREVMGDYFRHGNHKMAEPHGIGAMEPRHLRIGDTRHVLKESSRLLAKEQGEHGAVAVTREAGEAGGLADRMRRWTSCAGPSRRSSAGRCAGTARGSTYRRQDTAL